MITVEQIILLQLENKLSSKNDWYELSKNKFTEEVIRKYLDKLFIKIVCRYNIIPEDIIYKYLNNFETLNFLIATQNLSDKLKSDIIKNNNMHYKQHKSQIMDKTYTDFSRFTYSFIFNYSYDSNIRNILIYQNLSDKFINKNLKLIKLYIDDILFNNKHISFIIRMKLLHMKNNCFKHYVEKHYGTRDLKKNIYNKLYININKNAQN